MKTIDALKEAAKNQDTPRFERIIAKLESKGMPLLDLPLMVLNVNTVGIVAHKWAWDRIEDYNDR